MSRTGASMTMNAVVIGVILTVTAVGIIGGQSQTTGNFFDYIKGQSQDLQDQWPGSDGQNGNTNNNGNNNNNDNDDTEDAADNDNLGSPIPSSSSCTGASESLSACFGIEPNLYQGHVGNTVPIDIAFDSGSEVDLNIGGQSVGYTANVTVIDGNGDGRVVVMFNSWEAGRTGNAITAQASGDSVVLEQETTLDSRLEPADYPLQLRNSSDDSLLDLGTLSLQDMEVGPMRVYRMRDDASPSNVEQLNDAIYEGSTIAKSDKLVLNITVSSIYSFFKGKDDFGVGGVHFQAKEQDPEMNTDPEIVTSNALDKVFRRPLTSRVFLVLETDTAAFAPNDDDDGSDTFKANFSITSTNAYVSSGEMREVREPFHVVDGPSSTSLSLPTNDEGTHYVENSASYTISGSTAYAPGTQLALYIRSTQGYPYLLNTGDENAKMPVTADGTFQTTLDLSQLQPKGPGDETTKLRVEIRRDGNVIKEFYPVLVQNSGG
ncbi:MAG: hypothetical protein SV186_06960 [Candidatus Nanohaloarchaea archaeon]|nr:hypothetical protein [Candidatus Nanohaloarchaea archaeon]